MSTNDCPNQPGKHYDRWMSEWYCADGIAPTRDFDCMWFYVDNGPKCPQIKLDKPPRTS